MKWLNDPRLRSILAGGFGGLFGWYIAESILGAPKSFIATLAFGLFSGLGIGICLGIAEGLVLRSRIQAQRGAWIGLLIGMVGGAVGAGFAQAGYAATQGTSGEERSQPASVFSAEMQQRLQKANAKSGEVQIALVWHNQDDLDLHVVDPAGERIYFEHKKSASGGELDIDRNAACAQIDPEPVEHVVWATGHAPLGAYRVMVHYYKNCRGAASGQPTDYGVETLVDGKHEKFSGTISRVNELQPVTTFTREAPKTIEPPAQPVLGSILARIFGWLIFGALLGCAEGFTRRSAFALRNAAIGGAIGGASGGMIFEILARVLVPLGVSDAWCRGLGMIVLGACIGLWIVIIERAMSAVLSVRSGRLEGREIFLDRKEMRIGRNDALEIYLGGDAEIAAHHATIRREDGRHVIFPEGGTLLVNGSAGTQQALNDGDTIQIGKTRLVYQNRGSTSAPSTSRSAATVQTKVKPAPPPPPISGRPTPSEPPLGQGAPARPMSSTPPSQPKAAAERPMMRPPPPPPKPGT